MSQELDLPDRVFEAKPWFQTRPGEKILSEIKAFIRASGTPHLWRGHTHTKPQVGARIEYLGRFDLPDSCHESEDRWAPCPCCHLRHPKYYKNGMIAWFPDEHVIRCMGPQCFRKLNPEGHDAAYAEFKKEEQARKDIAYLLSNLPMLSELKRILEKALPTIEAIDTVRVILKERADNAIESNAPLWQHLRDGTLKVTVPREETMRLADGTHESRTVNAHITLGRISGYVMLDPRGRYLKPRIMQGLNAIAVLEQLGGADMPVKDMPHKDRRKIAGMFGNILKNANSPFTEGEELRRFLAPVTISTLRSWARHPGAPYQFHIALEKRDLHLGRSPTEYQRMPIPEAFWQVIPALPRISDTDISSPSIAPEDHTPKTIE